MRLESLGIVCSPLESESPTRRGENLATTRFKLPGRTAMSILGSRKRWNQGEKSPGIAAAEQSVRDQSRGHALRRDRRSSSRGGGGILALAGLVNRVTNLTRTSEVGSRKSEAKSRASRCRVQVKSTNRWWEAENGWEGARGHVSGSGGSALKGQRRRLGSQRGDNGAQTLGEGRLERAKASNERHRGVEWMVVDRRRTHTSNTRPHMSRFPSLRCRGQQFERNRAIVALWGTWNVRWDKLDAF
ncbi:hypothetical protein C8R46DRAFT_1040601 [Mycena filopes]|nr:hypothetical protein C8R46DRAFT_1040601 [Mycena filopes]